MPPSVPPLRVSVLRDGPQAVLRLAGELDLATAPRLAGRLRDLLEPLRRDPVHDLVVDLGGLAFADVSGLAVLLRAERGLRERGGSLALRGASPLLRRTLLVLGLQDRLPEEAQATGDRQNRVGTLLSSPRSAS